MKSKENLVKTLEAKIKALELENQKFLTNIETNNKEINELKTIIQSLSDNNSINNNAPLTPSNEVNNDVIDLKFKWKISELRKKLLL